MKKHSPEVIVIEDSPPKALVVRRTRLSRRSKAPWARWLQRQISVMEGTTTPQGAARPPTPPQPTTHYRVELPKHDSTKTQ